MDHGPQYASMKLGPRQKSAAQQTPAVYTPFMGIKIWRSSRAHGCEFLARGDAEEIPSGTRETLRNPGHLRENGPVIEG